VRMSRCTRLSQLGWAECRRAEAIARAAKPPSSLVVTIKCCSQPRLPWDETASQQRDKRRFRAAIEIDPEYGLP